MKKLKNYQFPVNIFLSFDIQEYRKYVEKKYKVNIESLDDTYGTVNTFGPDILVFLDKEEMVEFDKAVIMSIIVHEAVHVFQGIKEYIGENNAGDEIEAYTIQAIFLDILEHYERS